MICALRSVCERFQNAPLREVTHNFCQQVVSELMALRKQTNDEDAVWLAIRALFVISPCLQLAMPESALCEVGRSHVRDVRRTPAPRASAAMTP